MTSAVEEKAIELLQNLGLKEYEARCFTALTRLPSGTAREISETSDVPRTRVYEAVRVLESQGLVEVHQGNPQYFRAVGVDEAVTVLANRYSSRIDELDQALHGIGSRAGSDDRDAHEVWSLTGASSIAARANEMIRAGNGEVVIVVGSRAVLTNELYETLRETADAGVDVVIGAMRSEAREAIQRRVPGATVFESGLTWLEKPTTEREDVSVGVLLMVDRTALLVSSRVPGEYDGPTDRAVYGRGFSNGLVMIAHRLLSHGLQDIQRPAEE